MRKSPANERGKDHGMGEAIVPSARLREAKAQEQKNIDLGFELRYCDIIMKLIKKDKGEPV